MKLKEAVHENCGECGRIKRTVSEESFGCDNCKKPIDDKLKGSGKHREYLDLRIFSNDNRETQELQFCSWKCLLAKLPKVKCDYFIALPYLFFDEPSAKGIRAKDFIKAILGR